MEKKHIEDLAYLEFSNVRVLVDFQDYNISQDRRLLIPFSYYQRYGLINQNGEVVVEPKYDRILDSCREDSDVIRVGITYTYGFNRATKEPSTYSKTKWGLLDSRGDVLLEPDYQGIGISTDKKLLTLHHFNGQYEVVTIDGEVIVPKGKYPWIDSFDSGFARVNYFDGESKKYGLIDSTGKEVLPLQYSTIWNFYNRNRKWVTVEAIDEYGNKRVGRFTFLTRQLDI
nr:MAG TPA: WG containing repeat protein [Caudoviricetes sp.]